MPLVTMDFSRTWTLFLIASVLLLCWELDLSLASPSARTNSYETNHGNQQHSTKTNNLKQNYGRSTSEQNGSGSNVLPQQSTMATMSRNDSVIFLSPNRTNTNTNTFSSCTDETIATGKCTRPIGLDMRTLSLEIIRHDILRKLRLDENRLPNVSQISPEHLSKITGFLDIQQSDAPQTEYEDDHATTDQIFVFARTRQVKANEKSLYAHYFTFTDKLSNMGIDKVTLTMPVKFHEDATQAQRKGDFFIRVMQLIYQIRDESPVLSNYGPIKAVIKQPQPGEHHFRHENIKWVELDIRDVFHKLLANTPLTSSRKLCIVFDVTDAQDTPITNVSVLGGLDVSDQVTPFIQIVVSQRGHSRPVRDLGLDCSESTKETRCCRYPLTVDFDEFGWDWVIAPKQYEANYCSGDCPYAFLQKYPHNHIVQQVNRGIGGPCCTARKLSPITMLHFDQEANIVFSVLPGMLVDQCGCS